MRDNVNPCRKISKYYGSVAEEPKTFCFGVLQLIKAQPTPEKSQLIPNIRSKIVLEFGNKIVEPITQDFLITYQSRHTVCPQSTLLIAYNLESICSKKLKKHIFKKTTKKSFYFIIAALSCGHLNITWLPATSERELPGHHTQFRALNFQFSICWSVSLYFNITLNIKI